MIKAPDESLRIATKQNVSPEHSVGRITTHYKNKEVIK